MSTSWGTPPRGLGPISCAQRLQAKSRDQERPGSAGCLVSLENIMEAHCRRRLWGGGALLGALSSDTQTGLCFSPTQKYNDY